MIWKLKIPPVGNAAFLLLVAGCGSQVASVAPPKTSPEKGDAAVAASSTPVQGAPSEITTPAPANSSRDVSSSPTAAKVAAGDGVASEFVPADYAKLVGHMIPQVAKLDKNASAIKKAPEGVTAPQHGVLEYEGKKWAFVLDNPEAAAPRLFVDVNGDGDLTNDGQVEWKLQDGNGRSSYRGSVKVELEKGKLGQIVVSRIASQDKAFDEMKNMLIYFIDFGYQYSVTLDGKTFKANRVMHQDGKAALSIDRDGNGVQSERRERVILGEPFNFTGSTFVIASKNGELTMEKPATALPQMPMPVDMSVGKGALNFQAKSMEGKSIEFPKSYAGKIVMLDFWATWCGPCVGEIPHMKAAYSKWHEQGFEILGVTLDDPDMAESVSDFLKKKEAPWAQIYEGEGRDSKLAALYDVGPIPFVLLIDGDSGEILATGESLRGERLSDVIGEKLEAKRTGGK